MSSDVLKRMRKKSKIVKRNMVKKRGQHRFTEFTVSQMSAPLFFTASLQFTKRKK